MGQEYVARQHHRRLLKQIRTMWIEGVLESQETNQPPHPLPTGTSVLLRVYEETEGEGALVFQVEPGAGRTTLLLELARTLVERAEADEHQPLPVVFNLSSWVLTRPPLSDWLIEELRTTYEVPGNIGNAWIASQGILPLLDGLDEVAEEARPGCVQAINAYSQRQREKGAAPLVVVWCRSLMDKRNWTRAGVLADAAQRFPHEDINTIMAILDEYHTYIGEIETDDEAEIETARVQLAILELSEGDITKLREWVKEANSGFREVLMSAGEKYSSASSLWYNS